MSSKPYKSPQVEFLISAPDLKFCPDLGGKPEFALLGRSNAGKSSFINKLTKRKRLAHTSNTPGKTRLLNYYLVDDTWALVDLPGYGFAKVSKKEQARWREALEEYLRQREGLKGVVQLIDSRHGPQKNDIEMNRWLLETGVPAAVVLTKTDKSKKSTHGKIMAETKKALSAEKGYFLFSAETGDGAEAIWHHLREWRKS
ncbi:MAG: YihA family ribosome biogenesis GTP-binding protein [Candidatus Eremiobacteraeota bacterium]|nr:YihA family ribosome biogenesis GTP-binding protein [Candidatus Eremiobacteraeota bacterium]